MQGTTMWRSYRRLKYSILLFAVAYALVGSATWHWFRYEIFPIFSWDLFSYVPYELIDYGVKITRVGDSTPEPSLYYEAAGSFFPDAQSITAYTNIQVLGHAVEWGTDADVQRARQQFEHLHLNNIAPVHYEVWKRRSRPLLRWQTGTFLSEDQLASFQVAR